MLGFLVKHVRHYRLLRAHGYVKWRLFRMLGEAPQHCAIGVRPAGIGDPPISSVGLDADTFPKSSSSTDTTRMRQGGTAMIHTDVRVICAACPNVVEKPIFGHL
jgi:hypothetical protein